MAIKDAVRESFVTTPSGGKMAQQALSLWDAKNSGDSVALANQKTLFDIEKEATTPQRTTGTCQRVKLCIRKAAQGFGRSGSSNKTEICSRAHEAS